MLSKENDVPLKRFQNNDDFFIYVPCGQCVNCLKSKGNAWSLRLQLEYNYLSPSQKSNSYFVTLTLSDDYINEDKSLLIRRFLERIRKYHGVSVRHWIISEYGERTNRFHFHGLFFDIPFHRTQLLKYWKYGHIVIKPITPRRISYITQYVNKNLKNSRFPLEDPRYKQRIWCSKGLGSAVGLDKKVTSHLRLDGTVSPFMLNPSGHLTAIPRYLREKFFNHEELQTLKLAYYANFSEDVIPDPPYIIGSKVFTDYTLYLEECEKLKQQRKYINLKYGKRKSQSVIEVARY